MSSWWNGKVMNLGFDGTASWWNDLAPNITLDQGLKEMTFEERECFEHTEPNDSIKWFSISTRVSNLWQSKVKLF